MKERAKGRRAKGTRTIMINDLLMRYTNYYRLCIIPFFEGLRMTLFLEQNEYMGLFGQDAGASVSINPPDVSPLPDDESITIRPGVVTSIGIRFVSTFLLVFLCFVN